MTPGTSPHPPGTPSMRWMEAEHDARATAGPQLAKLAAGIYLAGLVLCLTTGWYDPAMAAGGVIGGLPQWHVGFLTATGTGIAFLTLARDEARPSEAATEVPQTTAGVHDLMAQMCHELRTPLNAVIGFSEVMLSELHGPLGNARYQEYAQHISDSGGRLLKSSEEALAVTAAMTALMTDRRGAKRERMIAATLVREAWRAAAPATGDARARLALTTCATCDLTGERRPTVQAFEHLLREALEHVPAGGSISVTGKRRGGRRSLEFRTEPAPEACEPAVSADLSAADGVVADASRATAGNQLRVILARLLLEMQGATFDCERDERGWSARVEFPARA
jgi:signal transduction histidine kinase